MNVHKRQAALSLLKSFDLARHPANEFVYLCAKFCDALVGTAAYEELTRRAAVFDQLTGPGSIFEDTRSELCRLCGGGAPSAQTGLEGKRSVWSGPERGLTVSGFREMHGEAYLAPHAAPPSSQGGPEHPSLPEAARNQRVLLCWWCVGPETIHDAEWARCNLHTLFATTESTVRSGFEFVPIEANDAFVRFRDQLWAVWRQADREHLLGAYLLKSSQHAVDAGLEQCENLVAKLTELGDQVKEVFAAAEDLCHQVEAPATENTQVTVNSSGKGNAPAGCEDQGIVDQVTVSFYGKRCVMRSEGRQALTLTEDETRLFTPLISLIVQDVPAGQATWESINHSIKETDPEWHGKQHPEAARRFSLLNRRLLKWGKPPDGEEWIGAKRGKNGGRCLNQSVRWLADYEDDVIKALARKSTSVSGPSLDPQTAEKSTPDREHKLPARPGRTTRRKPEDQDNE